MTAGRKVNTLSQEWCTPQKYVNAIKEFFDSEIDLDPCSNNDSIINAKIEYKLPFQDGLLSPWSFKN